MNTAFNYKTVKWQINWPQRISQHDVVYHSPPDDPMRGMPIGNGDVGVLFWCEDSKLIMVINKSDLWENKDVDPLICWNAEQEENISSLKHACRIIIDFQTPVFDIMYLSDFQGRLSLADASVSLTATTPFGRVSIKAFVGYDDGILHCDIRSNLKEDIPINIRIERFGSRSFSHWYYLLNRDAGIATKGTTASCNQNMAAITQKLDSREFSTACSVDCDQDLDSAYSVLSSRAASINICGKTKKHFFLTAAVTSPVVRDSCGLAETEVNNTLKKEFNDIFAEHKRKWKSFWLRSYMDYGDDYLNNLWHLNMFYVACSQRGKYPGRFINGLWGWNRDSQPWSFYYHWNQQMIYWPLNAAGHHELSNNYLDYRFDTLDKAKYDANILFGSKGAFVSDVTDAQGRNSIGEIHNITPVAQIALDFWRQYRFTKDEIFLHDKVVPYMTEACKMLAGYFIKCDDGKYHPVKNCGFEGWMELDDSIALIACGKALFGAAIEAIYLTDPQSEYITDWKELYNNLISIPITDALESVITKHNRKHILQYGLFKGDIAPSDKTLTAGYDKKKKKWLTTMLPPVKGSINDTATPESYSLYPGVQQKGIHWGTEYASVFPSGMIGLNNKKAEEFMAAVNTAKLYSPELLGWDMLPVVMARLGLGRELRDILRNWPNRWQIYCNGFCHWGPPHVSKKEAQLRFNTNSVEDASCSRIKTYADVGRIDREKTLPFPSWPFRHMSMEPLAILACSMNESLLQSYNGYITVAPAMEKHQNACFTLHAQDGFEVSAEIVNGYICWIVIKSIYGAKCNIKNPWKKTDLYKNGKLITTTGKKLLTINTKKNDKIIMMSDKNKFIQWQTCSIQAEKNSTAKHYGHSATLGLPKMF